MNDVLEEDRVANKLVQQAVKKLGEANEILRSKVLELTNDLNDYRESYNRLQVERDKYKQQCFNAYRTLRNGAFQYNVDESEVSALTGSENLEVAVNEFFSKPRFPIIDTDFGDQVTQIALRNNDILRDKIGVLEAELSEKNKELQEVWVAVEKVVCSLREDGVSGLSEDALNELNTVANDWGY